MRIKGFFFLSLFLLFIVTPITVTLVDINEDVSAFFSVTEEEEKSNKKNIQLEFLISKNPNPELSLFFYKKGNSMEYFFKNYNIPYLNILSPPPDLNII
ncbi:hypothetical protein [Patiriisocius hiemis]|uniref:Uncharacterized protein n=1 Tax=Patiriisocius hiemis TaxID=3075604 RepID=A0ABU2YBY1_9FLAO|nr:hypothetical protein [Constantimarinum sp. W242]MDT0555699.1 hypothetical protein [Constantimarinum sp. W242]